MWETFSPSFVTRSGSSSRITSPGSKSLQIIPFYQEHDHLHLVARQPRPRPSRATTTNPSEAFKHTFSSDHDLQILLSSNRSFSTQKSGFTFLCSGQLAAMQDLHWRNKSLLCHYHISVLTWNSSRPPCTWSISWWPRWSRMVDRKETQDQHLLRSFHQAARCQD